jgi:predicted metalloprotease with PDZ domain
VPRVPHPENLQPLFEEATGLVLGEFFDRHIRGTEDPELRDELAFVGIDLRATSDPSQTTDSAQGGWLGVTASGTKVTAVFDGSPAHTAGLSPGDELIAIDHYRATSDGDLRNLIVPRRIGETVQVSLFRRHRLVTLPVKLEHAPPTRYELATFAEPSSAVAARFQTWLGEPFPGANQMLATITTTARWV